MEQRTLEIIKILLQQKDFQTTGDIAKKISVSSKTVSRQIPKVEEFLNKAGLSLEKKSGSGILIAGSDVKKYLLAEKLKSAKKREYSQSERRSIIISKLLTSHEPIKLFVLSSAVNVTDSTISNDLDKLESWFNQQGLKLLRKPGLGVSLLGDERDIRRAIVKYIYENVAQSELLNLFQDNFNADKTPKIFYDLIDANNLKKFERMIQELEIEAGYKFSDNAFIGLTVHLSLTVQRIKNHEPVKISDEIRERLKNKKEFNFAERLAEKISADFNITVPQSEIFYITSHILGARSRYSSVGNISMTDNFKIVRMARQIMKNAAKITSRDIDKNQNLLAGLINHLTPTISRIKMHMDIRNPLLNEMKKHYPELLNLTKKCVVDMEKEIGEKLPEEEIAYIAMHIGAALADTEKFLHTMHRVIVACPAGMGTSRLLASRLRANFSTLKIVAEVPISEITPEFIAEKDFEFIISTVPVKINFPVIVVNATLSEEDKNLIESELSRQSKNFLKSAEEYDKRPPFSEALAKITAYGQTIISLMTNYFYLREQSDNINDVCKLAGELAGNDDQSKIEIANSLLIREDKGGTVITGHHMVLLHCKSKFIKSATFGILQLGEGFQYPEDDEIIQTAIVLLVPADADEYVVDTVGHIASVLLDRWGFIEILHEGDSDEIRGEMLKIFEEFYKSKQNELMSLQ